MTVETMQLFPEHAQALIGLMEQKMELAKKLTQVNRALDVLMGLLAIPVEPGGKLQVFPDGRLEITSPPAEVVVPDTRLVTARN